MEDTIISYIGNYGFPIVMCLWFMFRTEKVINKNSSAIDNLSDIIKQRGLK